jgi:hypothetical protein
MNTSPREVMNNLGWVENSVKPGERIDVVATVDGVLWTGRWTGSDLKR